jgi:pimeloyl-ACP methyl ester carboxylesterase
MVMTDREPIAAAAAASALSSWRRTGDKPVPTTLESARDLLSLYADLSIPEVQTIAEAGLTAITGTDARTASQLTNDGATSSSSSSGLSRGVRRRPTSLMVHGTRAWREAWWFTGGAFHTYVRQNVRSDLFNGRNTYSWSGAHRRRDRRLAAERLAGWTEDTIGGPLNTIFAHSYGGSIALEATAYGLSMRDLVLLSTPVENVRVEWRSIKRAQSLRIHLDIVLLATRLPQRFTENVEEHYLPHWFWNHGDSHDPDIWVAEACAKDLGL